MCRRSAHFLKCRWSRKEGHSKCCTSSSLTDDIKGQTNLACYPIFSPPVCMHGGILCISFCLSLRELTKIQYWSKVNGIKVKGHMDQSCAKTCGIRIDARRTFPSVLHTFRSVYPSHGQWPAQIGSWRVPQLILHSSLSIIGKVPSHIEAYPTMCIAYILLVYEPHWQVASLYVI